MPSTWDRRVGKVKTTSKYRNECALHESPLIDGTPEKFIFINPPTHKMGETSMPPFSIDYHHFNVVAFTRHVQIHPLYRHLCGVRKVPKIYRREDVLGSM